MMRYLILILSFTLHAFAALADDFPLVVDGRAATVLSSPSDHRVVALAVADLTRDITHVTGIAQTTLPGNAPLAGPVVLIGTLGQNPHIDQLVAQGQLDLGDLRGAWESFVITVVEQPFPGVPSALVIVGSDPRGTAFGTYELSAMIGVSPWYWWADVSPTHQDTLTIPAGFRRYGPPSVKYRGIFLNDEDWGLEPWAAQTFDPAYGNIGPKTYAKVFELLLRLKANTLWPAMHEVTSAFNLDPANAALADRYAIVMGSSHAEPLLRNNVGEWTAPKPDYNYVANRDGVRAYWKERMRTNGGYENLYTLGMRGIHDSGIQGTTTDAQRITVLEQVFADQRALLANYANPEVAQVPQIFCAYKEVLDLYRQGLRVPDDVTIVWPDDNFGYVRNFASATERERSGGFGIYYHLSYLGRPMAYLWLGTTPPALIWEEMTKAYAHGADRVWIVNVGDLKPAEIGTEFFLDLAWDIDAYGPDAQPRFLENWATATFGPTQAATIADVMNRFYVLNNVRKPEHLQWWTPLKEEPHPSPFTRAEIDTRLTAFTALRAEVDRLTAALPTAKQDAFFELVAYPVHGAALANERYFAGELGDAPVAHAADTALHALTREFDLIANGKWRGFMRLEPADNDWRSMRIGQWEMPDFASKTPIAPPLPPTINIDLAPSAQAPWHVIPGLGHSGQAIGLWPFDTVGETELHASFVVPANQAGTWTLELHRLPTHPIDPALGQPVTITLNDDPALTLDATTPDGSDAWKQGVLAQRSTHTLPLGQLLAGPQTLTLRAGPGLIIDGLQLTRE